MSAVITTIVIVMLLILGVLVLYGALVVGSDEDDQMAEYWANKEESEQK